MSDWKERFISVSLFVCVCVCVDTNMIGVITWTCLTNNNPSFIFIFIAMIHHEKWEMPRDFLVYNSLTLYWCSENALTPFFLRQPSFCSCCDGFVTNCKLNYLNEVLSCSQITYKYLKQCCVWRCEFACWICCKTSKHLRIRNLYWKAAHSKRQTGQQQK